MNTQRIPQRGLPKPPPKRYPKTMATSTVERIQRQPDGTYRVTHWKENRCCLPMQIGSAQICVMNDYGFWVVVRVEDAPWC